MSEPEVKQPFPPGVMKAAEQLDHSRTCSAGWDFESQCTCGLEWRIKLQTEQEMHNAWRKRAEEAEPGRKALVEALKLCLADLEAVLMITTWELHPDVRRMLQETVDRAGAALREAGEM